MLCIRGARTNAFVRPEEATIDDKGIRLFIPDAADLAASGGA